jgi:hypothetical protein
MIQSLKDDLFILNQNYFKDISPSDIDKIKFLQKNISNISTFDDSFIQKHKKFIKSFSKIQEKINNLISWQKILDDAPKKLNRLESSLFNANKLFCMDLELSEVTKDITEVGIAILDNKSFSFSTYHFIVAENYHFRNGQRVADNKDNFSYGISKILPLKDIMLNVRQLLDGVDFLIGHAFDNDYFFLEQCGFNKKLEVFDTQEYGKIYLEKNQQMSLHHLVRLILKEEALYLHNAGNDAFYTLSVMLEIANIYRHKYSYSSSI